MTRADGARVPNGSAAGSTRYRLPGCVMLARTQVYDARVVDGTEFQFLDKHGKILDRGPS